MPRKTDKKPRPAITLLIISLVLLRNAVIKPYQIFEKWLKKPGKRAACAALLLISLITACLSCTGSKKAVIDNKLIVTSINPYFLMVKQIVQTKMDVELFIPAGASPHTFSPSPADIQKLEKAGLIIVNGLHLEESIMAKLETIKNRVLIAADCLPAASIIDSAEHDHDETSAEQEAADHDHQGADPHIWLQPDNLLIIAEQVKERIIQLFPEEQHYFEYNWRILTDSIKQVNNEITMERRHYSDPRVITFHNSFGYFLEKFNIRLAAVIEQSPGKEPTARELVEIGKKAAGAGAIFIEPQLSSRAAEIIAEEYGLQVDTLDPLGFAFKSMSPVDILRKNWNIMKKYFPVRL